MPGRSACCRESAPFPCGVPAGLVPVPDPEAGAMASRIGRPRRCDLRRRRERETGHLGGSAIARRRGLLRPDLVRQVQSCASAALPAGRADGDRRAASPGAEIGAIPGHSARRRESSRFPHGVPAGRCPVPDPEVGAAGSGSPGVSAAAVAGVGAIGRLEALAVPRSPGGAAFCGPILFGRSSPARRRPCRLGRQGWPVAGDRWPATAQQRGRAGSQVIRRAAASPPRFRAEFLRSTVPPAVPTGAMGSGIGGPRRSDRRRDREAGEPGGSAIVRRRGSGVRRRRPAGRRAADHGARGPGQRPSGGGAAARASARARQKGGSISAVSRR